MDELRLRCTLPSPSRSWASSQRTRSGPATGPDAAAPLAAATAKQTSRIATTAAVAPRPRGESSTCLARWNRAPHSPQSHIILALPFRANRAQRLPTAHAESMLPSPLPPGQHRRPLSLIPHPSSVHPSSFLDNPPPPLLDWTHRAIRIRACSKRRSCHEPFAADRCRRCDT